MKKLLFINLFLILFISCINKNPDSIKSKSDNDVVGYFDKEKFPLIQEAIKLQHQNKDDEAIKKFDEAEDEYGKSVIISLNRGVAYRKLRKLNLAVDDFSYCLELNPNYYPALVNRGIVYGYLNDYAEALNDLDKAIKLNPEHPIGYLNRAVIYMMQKNNDLACEDLIRAKNNDSNN